MRGRNDEKKITRRNFVASIGAGGIGLAAEKALGRTRKGSSLVMENDKLRLAFDRASGLLAQLDNKLTNESFVVHGDDFSVAAKEFTLSPSTMRLQSLERKTEELVEVTYGDGSRTVVAAYKLGTRNHFFEKQIRITSASPFRLTNLFIARLDFAGPETKVVRYPYQKNVVYFVRSPKGGLMTGMELPFDDSATESGGTIRLGYKPSLKVKQDEVLESEPIFVGIYKRRSTDTERANFPLHSESEAMVGMTSAIIGPPRHGIMAIACGWWCEMEHFSYQSEPVVKADMQSIDFMAECGLDGFTDNHPWSGETAKMNALRQNDHYAPGPLVIDLLRHANEKKVGVIFWPTMTNTHPWWKEEGKPFRLDRPDWLMDQEAKTRSFTFQTGLVVTEKTRGNCIANRPFWDWLMGLQLDGMQTGYFSGWVMDGDFFGGGGIVNYADCPSDEHDHLPGDSNYACERALRRMMATIREKYPQTYIGPMCRPAQDLGIWSNRHADAVFTLDEMGQVAPLPGQENPPVNVMCGDKIRKWSRVRVHENFFPHYLDQPQVFVAPLSMDAEVKRNGPPWPSEKIDYVMLSALSCSPTQLYYLPTKVGTPDEDKREIRKWLEWGRENVEYLKVRRDLPQPPAVGQVDGSAHIVGDNGLMIFFNPNPGEMTARFVLDEETIGITSGARFELQQSYPAGGPTQTVSAGSEVTWPITGFSPLILKVKAII